MAYDCRFQATLKDQIPQQYLKYISKEDKSQIQLPDERQMFVKKCMTQALYRKIPPRPSTILMERVKRNGLKHSIFNSGGDLYIGEWKNDKKEGHGSFKTHSGKVLYEGEWVNGKPEGYGVLCHQGDHKRYNISFEGFWKDGKPQGKGNHFYKDGSYYEGAWENGVRNGFGKMWHANGTYYEGYFYNDKRHGRGLFVYVNGNRYIGDWNADFKHGFGAFYYMSSGQIQMGHWIKNSCVNSWMIDMKFRQTVERPSEFSIPEKSHVVKQFKRVNNKPKRRSRRSISISKPHILQESHSDVDSLDNINVPSTPTRPKVQSEDVQQKTTGGVPKWNVDRVESSKRNREKPVLSFWKEFTAQEL